MREQIFAYWRTIVATCFAFVLIVGVYAIGKGIESPPTAKASAESALLQAIATKDSDGDGLPDWGEALYDSDPHKTDTFNLGMTDGEAVSRGLIVPEAVADIPDTTSSSGENPFDSSLPPAPPAGTLTAAFAQTFFTLFVQARQANGGADLSEAQVQEVSDQALKSISDYMDIAPDFKSAKDITVSRFGPDALKGFAIDAEAVLMRNTHTATTSEIDYLTHAVEGNDSVALRQMASISNAYRGSAVGLSVLKPPQELAADDLALINALMRMSQIISDFTKVNDDPLITMLALKQYPQAVLDLANAFIRIGAIYKNAGVSLPAGTPGAAFVNLIANIAARQEAAKKL